MSLRSPFAFNIIKSVNIYNARRIKNLHPSSVTVQQKNLNSRVCNPVLLISPEKSPPFIPHETGYQSIAKPRNPQSFSPNSKNPRRVYIPPSTRKFVSRTSTGELFRRPSCLLRHLVPRDTGRRNSPAKNDKVPSQLLTRARAPSE